MVTNIQEESFVRTRLQGVEEAQEAPAQLRADLRPALRVQEHLLHSPKILRTSPSNFPTFSCITYLNSIHLMAAGQ